MKKLTIIVGAALVAVLGLTAIALSQDGPGTLTENPSPERPVMSCGSHPGPFPITTQECDDYARAHGEWSMGQSEQGWPDMGE